MAITDIGTQTCSVARSIAVVGDAWTLMILRELFLGSRRFDDLQTFTGASPHLVSLRMRALVDSGIVERRAYQQRPVRHEYRLTEKGLDLWPVITALRAWGDRWEKKSAAAPPAQVRHRRCGHIAEMKIVCSACSEPFGPREADVELSPAAQAARRGLAERGHSRQRRAGAARGPRR